MAPKEDARKAQSSNDHANTEQEDETDTDEDRGNGLNADEPQRETGPVFSKENTDTHIVY